MQLQVALIIWILDIYVFDYSQTSKWEKIEINGENILFAFWPNLRQNYWFVYKRNPISLEQASRKVRETCTWSMSIPYLSKWKIQLLSWSIPTVLLINET